jgi:hypothetical protein
MISTFAPSLARQGYGVLAVAYWAETGLPPTLTNIPFEYFDSAVDWPAYGPMVPGAELHAAWTAGGKALPLLAQDPSAVGRGGPQALMFAAALPQADTRPEVDIPSDSDCKGQVQLGEDLPLRDPGAFEIAPSQEPDFR